jgi:hypothetical protein
MKQSSINEEDIQNINVLAAKCFKNAFEKGFWDESISQRKNADSPEQVKLLMGLYSAQNLMLAVSELGEALEAERKGRVSDWDIYRAVLQAKEVDFDASAFAEFIKDSKGDEIADCIIRLLQQCDGEGINIGEHIAHKMAYNAQRERLHGKKF